MESPSADLPEIRPALANFYASGVESTRLAKAPLELERSKAILAERLPSSGRVLDVGGGTGIYAAWLAERGYQVDLIEPVPLHVDQARQTAMRGASFDVHLGEARMLDFPDGVADAVLLMGPLYCLLQSDERARALRESFRVLRPGGVLAAAALGRLTPFLQAVSQNWIVRPGEIERVMSAIETGRIDYVMFDRAARGTRSEPVTLYMHRPEELQNEVADAGFSQVEVLAVTGSYLRISDFNERLADPVSRQKLLEAMRSVEADPGIVGISNKLMAVAQRPGI
jgi:SAM-dependent methyltransferase